MATYKVLQDIEAEDKFVGPLTLRQFIYAAITALCLYLSFWALTKHVPFFLAILLPPAFVSGLLAWPWSRDQPTEVWILAKVRFALKPRRRIWDQTGISDLVTITVPKHEEKVYTNDLSQTEVKSRLRALADTIDSRGWAVKNVNVNLTAMPAAAAAPTSTDRLVDVASIPKEVSTIDVQAADDVLDTSNPVAHQLDEMIKASDQNHRQEAIDRMQNIRDGKPDKAAQDLWFMQPKAAPQPPGYATFEEQTVTAGTQPTATNGTNMTPEEEQKLLAQLHPDTEERHPRYGHMKVIQPLSQQKAKNKKQKDKKVSEPAKVQTNPVIQQLAVNNDLNVDTIARQANKNHKEPPDEVVVSLH